MCGRYVSHIEAAMEREWTLRRPPPLFDSYNVAPTQDVPVVRDTDEGRECILMRWGLVPFWAKGVPPKYSTINARIETITTAPTWRGPWKRDQRWILPTLGFYEWQDRPGGRQPHYIHLTDQALFGFAGLWDSSTGSDATLESAAIITMPAILRREDHVAWLEGDSDAALGYSTRTLRS